MWALFKNGERVNEFYWNSYEKAFQVAFNYEHDSIAYDGANQPHLKEGFTIEEVKE